MKSIQVGSENLWILTEVKSNSKISEIVEYEITHSEYIGDYYVSGLDRFNEGDLVKIYQLYSQYNNRIFCLDRYNQQYRIHPNEFSRNFLNKENWRAKQINKIL